MANQKLIEAIREKRAILFVGAGVSMCLNLPSWRGLIEEAARQLGYDPDIYSTFGDYLLLAEYYESVKGSIGPLRSWMDVTWHSSSIKIEKSAVHRIIVELSFPIIYTTNYDRWLEKAFDYYGKAYAKIVNAGDLTLIKEGITQIVKLHGDFDDDSSIVLTESSYFERLNFESPLDIRLRADILGRPILFIGYNLSDINIRYLLFKLQKLWESSSQSKVRPESYIFLSRPNPVQEKVLKTRSIIPIFSPVDDPGEGLKLFLEQLSRESTFKT